MPEPDVGRSPPLLRPGDQLGEAAVAVGADDEVHLGHALEQRGAPALRHAAHHAEHGPGPLEALQQSQTPQDPLLRVVAHRTGVDEHHVRFRGVRGADVAMRPEQPDHELGVGDVHLAAVGLDVNARHR
jgi:hypothetical protein